MEDPTPMSKQKQSIRVLICSANLGNAQPNDVSVDAWIPDDGKCKLALLNPPKFPVIMDPRRATNPHSKPVDNNSESPALQVQNPAQDPLPPKEAAPSESNLEHLDANGFPSTRNSAVSDYQNYLDSQAKNDDAEDDYAAFLKMQSEPVSLAEENSYEADAYAVQASDTGDQQQNETSNAAEASGSSTGVSKEDKANPNSGDGEPECDHPFAMRPSFVGTKKSDNTPLIAAPESGDSSGSDNAFHGFGAFPEGHSDGATENETSNAFQSTKALFEADFSFDATFPEMPAPPDDLEGSDTESAKSGSLSQPEGNPTTAADEDKFDIIVIGMQEATFKTSSAETDQVEEALIETVTEEENHIDLIDDDSLSSSSDDESDEEFSETARFTRGLDSSDYDGRSKRSKTAKAKKVLGATLKAGIKVGKKVGKETLKVGKKTVETAKTVNTLASEKDHTDRMKPTPQQAVTPMGDGGFGTWSDTDTLHYMFDDQLPSYRRALSYQLGEMRMMIYSKLSDDVDFEVLSVKTQATGKAGLANKGGIVAEVVVNNSTRLSFLTAHLEAHEGAEKYMARCTSLQDILMGTKSSSSPLKCDVSLASHFSFAMGDLNFRTKLAGVEAGSQEHISLCHQMAAHNNWLKLNKFDELAKALRTKDCLVGFRTPYCNFDPTFKVAREDGYAYNVKRSPSFTDRILFKTGDQLEPALHPLLYEPIEHFTTSDHKPIRGAFSIDLNQSLRWNKATPLTRQTLRRGATKVEPGVEPGATDTVSRETMHLFVSSMQCTIFPNEYDRIRKVEKAELPHPYISFITSPPQAVQTDSSKKSLWRKIGFGGSSSSSKPGRTKSDSRPNRQMSATKSGRGFPTTSTLPKGTMRPNWNEENLHFTVRTHLIDGSPIELSGSILYVTLFDGKGMEARAIGCFPLNLARLIAVSRYSEGETQMDFGSSGAPPPRGGPSRQMGGRAGRMAGRVRDSSPKRQGSRAGPPRDRSPQRGNDGTRIRDNSPAAAEGWKRDKARSAESGGRGAAPSRAPPGRGHGGRGRGARAARAGSGRGRGRMGGRRHTSMGRGTGWSYASPSDAFLAASAGEAGYPTPVQTAAKSLHSTNKPGGKPQQVGRTSLNSGPSPSLRNVMAEDQQGGGDKVDKTLHDLKVVSLKIDEALLESGVEVGRIRCCIDVWWMDDSPTLS